VEVEQHRDPLLVEHPVGAEDPVEIGVVVDPGLGLERLPDDPEPDHVEAVLREEASVVPAEARAVRRIARRRKLLDHVEAMEGDDPASGVRDEAPGVAVGFGGTRGLGLRDGARRQSRQRECGDGDQKALQGDPRRAA
jgi:hypothetical protein